MADSVVFLLEVCGGKGGEFPPLNSFRSAKSRRPLLEALRRERPLEWGDDSHSLDDEEAEEERARPWDFTGTEVTVLVWGRALTGEL